MGAGPYLSEYKWAKSKQALLLSLLQQEREKKKKVAKIGNEMQREDGSGKFENSRADSHTLLPPPLVRCVILGFFYTHRCVFMFRTPRRLSVDFRSQGGKIGEVSVQVCLSARHAIWRWVEERKDSWECPAQYEKQK